MDEDSQESNATPSEVASVSALWLAGDLSWKLWEQSLALYHMVRNLPPSVAKAIFLCSRQFSKSVTVVLMALEDAIQNPDSCILIMGPDNKQAIGIVAPRIKMLCRDMPRDPYPFVRRSKSENKWFVGPKDRESEIVIGGFNENSSSQRGKSLFRIYIEEVVDAKPDQYIDSMENDIGPALLHAKDAKIVIATTWPKVPDHPFCTKTLPEAEATKSVAFFTIYDNKQITVGQFVKAAENAGCEINHEAIGDESQMAHERGREELQKILKTKSISWLREYECENIRDEQAVACPSFTMDCVREFTLPDHAIMEMTSDIGGVKDPHAFVMHCYDYNNDMLLFWDAIGFPINTSTHVICQALDLWYSNWAREMGIVIQAEYGDCSGQTSIDMLESGHHLIAPMKADWTANLRAFDTLFAKRKVLVHPRCEQMIIQLRSGQLNDQRTDFLRTEGPCGHCDFIAAGMYANRMANRRKPDPNMIPRSSNVYHPAPRHLHSLEEVAKKVMNTRHDFKRKGFGQWKR